jgi:hypothetical protein
MTPEERALHLQQSGWVAQDRSQINLAAGPGVAIRPAEEVATNPTVPLNLGKSLLQSQGSRNPAY